jgi:hypothetical protein
VKEAMRRGGTHRGNRRVERVRWLDGRVPLQQQPARASPPPFPPGSFSGVGVASSLSQPEQRAWTGARLLPSEKLGVESFMSP